MLYEVW